MTLVIAQTAGGVATLTLNRHAKRNALSRDLLAELGAALARVSTDGAFAIILTGAGHCFSAGGDIAELTGTADDIEFDDVLSGVVEAIQEGPFLSIAAVAGPCVGAGLDLACACDLRIVSTSSFFELPSVRMGLLYNPASLARLHKILPSTTLRRLLLLGQRIQGSEAVTAGFAMQVADDEQILALAEAHARRAIGSPRALIATKKFLVTLDRAETNLEPWLAARAELLSSAERRAAMKLAKSQMQL